MLGHVGWCSLDAHWLMTIKPARGGAGYNDDTRVQIDAANREALEREVRAARAIAGRLGLVAVNVMRAVSDYVAYVKTSLRAGADMVVVGAGLPLDLPDLAIDHPQA